MTDQPPPLQTYRTPAPTDDQSIAERKYKRLVGIVKHNEPARTSYVKLNFSRSYSWRDFRSVLRRAMDNGHVHRRRDGWVVDESVE